MNSSSRKMYGIDAVDDRNLIKQFYSLHCPYAFFVESTINRILPIYKAFSTGMVTGKILIDFCPASILLHCFPVKDFVEKITLIQINDESVQEIEKWLTKHPDAHDWSHAACFLRRFKGISDESDNEEENTRRKIKVRKWDLSDYNPAEALSLPAADIVTCMWFLEVISKDHDECRRNLRRISYALKPEGFLMILTNVNSSYFKVGEEIFHFLCCDESFYRKLLPQEGFTIKHYETFDRAMITDDIDHEKGIFIVAKKVREP